MGGYGARPLKLESYKCRKEFLKCAIAAPRRGGWFWIWNFFGVIIRDNLVSRYTVQPLLFLLLRPIFFILSPFTPIHHDFAAKCFLPSNSATGGKVAVVISYIIFPSHDFNDLAQFITFYKFRRAAVPLLGVSMLVLSFVLHTRGKRGGRAKKNVHTNASPSRLLGCFCIFAAQRESFFVNYRSVWKVRNGVSEAESMRIEASRRGRFFWQCRPTSSTSVVAYRAKTYNWTFFSPQKSPFL